MSHTPAESVTKPKNQPSSSSPSGPFSSAPPRPSAAPMPPRISTPWWRAWPRAGSPIAEATTFPPCAPTPTSWSGSTDPSLRRCSRPSVTSAAASCSQEPKLSGPPWACTVKRSSPRTTPRRTHAAWHRPSGCACTRSSAPTSGTCCRRTSAARCCVTTACWAASSRRSFRTRCLLCARDWEWILGLEAPELVDLVDLMRHLRSTEARNHVREEIPFYTGRRITAGEIAEVLA
jgi:hypothetical protein